MARISLEPKRTLGYRLVRLILRRPYGVVLDRDLEALAILGTSARTGCAWCMDFGYWEHHHAGVDATKLRAVTHWRGSGLYTALGRRAMAYAEAMTATPPEVTDEMVAQLRADLSEAQLVELTATVGLENLRNRTNAALGLAGQGFTDRCEVPAS